MAELCSCFKRATKLGLLAAASVGRLCRIIFLGDKFGCKRSALHFSAKKKKNEFFAFLSSFFKLQFSLQNKLCLGTRSQSPEATTKSLNILFGNMYVGYNLFFSYVLATTQIHSTFGDCALSGMAASQISSRYSDL